MCELLPDSRRFRVIVSTDIGGSDPDDFQSMMHYLVYSDLFDTEGLISSAWGDGRKEDILSVLGAYEQDYPCLKTRSQRYPEPDALRALCRQGAVGFAPWKGWSQPTEGSELIVQCAKKPDGRPLYVLVWGLLEDVAQALHDAPEIAPKLRIVYIGGPNKKWGPNAYAYIYRHFPDLWMIENNSTYRGWFCGGDQAGKYGNERFVSDCVAGYGALGRFFADKLPAVKMGDTPAVAYLLSGSPEDPCGESWGGSFEQVYAMPSCVLTCPFAPETSVEVFSVTEIRFPTVKAELTEQPAFSVQIGEQFFEGFRIDACTCAFRFVPKQTGTFSYTLHSAVKELDGLTGRILVTAEDPKTRKSGPLTRWYSDRLEQKYAEGPHCGARTVSQWRKAFLDSFAERMKRCCEAENEVQRLGS